MLRTEALNLFNRASLPKKWRKKWIGPLLVEKKMGLVTYQIKLPGTMKRAHNTFHVSKLKAFHRSPDETGPLSVVIDADGNVEQKVFAILAKKRERRKIHYLVQFDGESPSEAIWLPKSELKHCMDLIKDFEARQQA